MKRIVPVMVLFGVVALAVAGMWLASNGIAQEDQNDLAASSEVQMTQRSNIPLATLLYLGFGFDKYNYEPVGGLGSRGWNSIQGDALYEGLVISRPEIGWYASKNLETIAWQLEQMQRAGISVIFLSWQGWGDDNLDGKSNPGSIAVEYEATAKMVVDYIKDNNLPFLFSIFVEEFPDVLGGTPLNDLNDDQRQMVVDYLWDNYFSTETYGDIAFLQDGKPFVAGGSFTPGQWWEIPGFNDPRFHLTEVYNIPDREQERLSAAYYTPPPSYLPSPEGVAVIWPRHDGLLPLLAQNTDWLNEDNFKRVDPYGREGAYDRAWKEIIEYRPRSDLKFIWLWIWNSYAEVTYIEPDSGIGPYAVGDLYVRKTRHYYDLLRSGQPFREYTPDWVSLEEFRPTIGNVPYQDLGLASEYEKDALLRRLLRQAQDWIVQYTGRTFGGDVGNVLGWIELDSAGSTVVVAPYRDVESGTVFQIGTSDGVNPVEFAQVKRVSVTGGLESWELAHPLKKRHAAGEVIVEVSPAGSYGIGEIPPSIKEATTRLAGNMWHYIVHTPKGRLMNFENIGVAQIDDAVFTDGIKRDLDLWKKRGRIKVYSP